MLKLSLYDYINAYILFKETASVQITATADANTINGIIKVILKNLAIFTNGISEIENTQVNNA